MHCALLGSRWARRPTDCDDVRMGLCRPRPPGKHRGRGGRRIDLLLLLLLFTGSVFIPAKARRGAVVLLGLYMTVIGSTPWTTTRPERILDWIPEGHIHDGVVMGGTATREDSCKMTP
jgi:hypothetical protein